MYGKSSSNLKNGDWKNAARKNTVRFIRATKIIFNGINGTNTGKIGVVIQGCLSRQNTYLQASIETWGRHFHLIIADETTHPNCIICPYPETVVPKYFRSDWVPFGDKDTGWYCGNQRYLPTLRYAINEYKRQGLALDWILQIDDDTFVQPINLLFFVQGQDPDEFVVFGDRCV